MTWMDAFWLLSLVAELGVILGMWKRDWYRLYPRFLAYLIFDLTASVFLFGISTLPSLTHPGLYDYAWRGTQLGLIIGRVWLVAESYQRLTIFYRNWRFSDGVIYPLAGIAALLLHSEMVGELRWPDSELETIFSLIGAANAMMGFSLIGILASSQRRQLGQTVQYWHAKILCAYLLLTSACYYSAAYYSQVIGLPLMIVATFCYAVWLGCVIQPRRISGDDRILFPVTHRKEEN